MGIKRTSAAIRSERDQVAAQIETLRKRQKALSDELRAAEGPIPDRGGRAAKEAGYSIKPAS